MAEGRLATRLSADRRPRGPRRALAVAGGVIAIVAAPALAPGDTRSVLIDIGVRAQSSPRVEHVFGGRTVSVPIVLYADPRARVDLRGRLVQLAPGLAAPIGADTAIASGLGFSTSFRRELTHDVVVPSVEREASFELIVFVRVHPEETWRRAGSVFLRAYPGEQLAPLKRWAERRSLRVRDASGVLERFLTAQGVAFLDLNAKALEESDGAAVTLLVGGADDLAVAKDRARSGEAVIVFRERSAALPRTVLARVGAGAVMVVELEVLGRLSADPRAQKVFLDMVDSARAYSRGGEEGVWHEDEERR